MGITNIVRIFASVAMIIFAGAATASATGAFFSDTETSTGNTFTAGSIDLQIDNESYVTNELGALQASATTTWSLSDLTNQVFFSFTDLKPEAFGEDTISLHAGDNDAWACTKVTVTATPENTPLEPEQQDGDTAADGPSDGELQDDLNFVFWHDDGDNVFEVGEVTIGNMSGVANTIFDGTWKTIGDFGNSITLTGGQEHYVAKAWCFGALSQSAVTQDGQGKTGSNGPLIRGTGFTCDGSGVDNVAQTDSVVANVEFYATQTRNNSDFLCSSLNPTP